MAAVPLAACLLGVVRVPSLGRPLGAGIRRPILPVTPSTPATTTLGELSGLRQISWLPEPLLEKLDSVSLNAAVVTVLGAWCAYVVLNVDAEICRG
jgi:hypothetical protein